MLAVTACAPLLGLVLAAPPPEPAARFAPRPPQYGYSLQEEWETLWRRFQDRTGRGDELGPLLQLRPDLDRREYPLTVAVADFPMRWERDWSVQARGARLWMHSDDEFTFANRVQVKERVRMGRKAYLGLRYDRLETRTLNSSLLRLDFAFQDIGGSGSFVELRANMRANKPDLDAQVAIGQAFDWGRLTGRVLVFDPVTNASDALVQARKGSVERRFRQKTLAYGWTVEAQTRRLHGVRGEAYFGNVVPNRLRVEYREDSPNAGGDLHREQSALVGGALVEWANKSSTMHVGAATTLVSTHHAVDFDDPQRESYRAPERQAIVQAWWLGHPARDLDLQVRLRYRRTGLGEVESLPYRRIRNDQSMLLEARATWLFTRPFGMELGYSLLKRDTTGSEPLIPYLAATDHRALLRFVLRFRQSFWTAFGAGFDIDRSGGIYDQAGMTMILRW